MSSFTVALEPYYNLETNLHLSISKFLSQKWELEFRTGNTNNNDHDEKKQTFKRLVIAFLKISIVAPKNKTICSLKKSNSVKKKSLHIFKSLSSIKGNRIDVF